MWNMVISSQSFKSFNVVLAKAGSETIPFGSTSRRMRDGSASPPAIMQQGDDIVHPFRKLEDKCNQLVVGSNPTPGAKPDKQAQESLFFRNIRPVLEVRK